MLTFHILGNELKIENALFIDARFVVAEHPETGEPCLFIRGDLPRPYSALKKLGMRVKGNAKQYNNIDFYELEESDGKEDGEEYEVNLLLGGHEYP